MRRQQRRIRIRRIKEEQSQLKLGQPRLGRGCPFLGASPSPIDGGVDANTLHVAALQKADSAGIGLHMTTTKASVATQFRQGSKPRLAGDQIHRIAAALTFADHMLSSHWPGSRAWPIADSDGPM